MRASTSAPAAGAPRELLVLAEQISSQLAEIQSNTVPPPPTGYTAIKAAAKAKALKLKEDRAAAQAAAAGVAAAQPTTYDKYTEGDAKNMCFCLGCASCCCSIIPFCGKRLSTCVASGFKCHLRAPCSCLKPPKCNCCCPPPCCWPPPCLICLKCTTVGCQQPFCCCKTKLNCCHFTCGCFPMILYPLIKILCCANFEKIDENKNVGAPLKEAKIKQVESGAPQAAVMVRNPVGSGAGE